MSINGIKVGLAMFACLVLYTEHSYSRQLEVIWVRQYWGPGLGVDYPCVHGIAVDDYENVYVAGRSKGINTDFDYVLIKYDANGNQQFTVRYDQNNGTDIPRAMIVDDSGYIYLTGQAGPLLTSTITTIKYKPDGDTCWVRKYSVPNGYFNCGRAIAIDGSYNVYVTGYETDQNIDLNCVTIKYDKNGNQQWSARYDISGTTSDYNEGYDLWVDNSGNIYVVGGTSDAAGNNEDYLTIKYNPSGAPIWVRTWNSGSQNSDWATKVALDVAGNVYVAGSANNRDRTIKYDTNGNLLWTSQSDPTNWGQEVTDLCVDGYGRPWTTAYYYGNTIKYNNQNGTIMWSWEWPSPGNSAEMWDMEMDPAGGVYITGRSQSGDYATVKFDSTGAIKWQETYDGYGYLDVAYGITVNSAGYIWITGHVNVASSDSGPIVTIKYKESEQGREEDKVNYLTAPDIKTLTFPFFTP